jgi:hypothetical protein
MTDQDEFMDALDRGDHQGAAAALRKLKSLDGEALELVADLLEGDPSVRHFHPFRLALVRWRGRPSDAIARQVRATRIGLFGVPRLMRSMKVEAAVAEVARTSGLGRTTVFKAYERFRKKPASPTKGGT